MFTYKRTVLYCSAANTFNISVFGRLTAYHCSHASSAAGSSAADEVEGPANAEAEDLVRKFLMLRGLWPAACLLAAQVQESYVQLQAGLTAAGQPDPFPAEVVLLLGPDHHMQIAREALSTCSTPGEPGTAVT